MLLEGGVLAVVPAGADEGRPEEDAEEAAGVAVRLEVGDDDIVINGIPKAPAAILTDIGVVVEPRAPAEHGEVAGEAGEDEAGGGELAGGGGDSAGAGDHSLGGGEAAEHTLPSGRYTKSILGE